MVRMADGSYVPASQPDKIAPLTSKKLLVVLQYYEGDQEAAEQLGALIADLERVRNKTADILIHRRFDAPEFSRTIRSKLEEKFDKVYFETCRRKDAKGYPFAANQMWSDLVMLMGQFNPWRTDYYAFLPLEADCTPLRPGWIQELGKNFLRAKAEGFAVTGFVHNDPVLHVNGVAVYDINIWGIVGGGKLGGSDPQIAYDIYHGRNLAPITADTGLIMFQYRRPTISADDLFRAWRYGMEPVLFHGVKDASAREAVRAKWITFSKEKDISRKTVFTYQTSPDKQLEKIWSDAWRSRGWNPVVLNIRDSSRNPHALRVSNALLTLPFAANADDNRNRIMSWLALDSMGAGLLVDIDVLPGNFTPANMPEESDLLGCSDQNIRAMYFTRAGLAQFIDHIVNYKPTAKDILQGAPHVTDLNMLAASDVTHYENFKLKTYGEPGWAESPLVGFRAEDLMKFGKPGIPSQLMTQYLENS